MTALQLFLDGCVAPDANQFKNLFTCPIDRPFLFKNKMRLLCQAVLALWYRAGWLGSVRHNTKTVHTGLYIKPSRAKLCYRLNQQQ